MIPSVLAVYGFITANAQVGSFGTGLINHTWKVADGINEYILQKINHSVFREPETIAHNITLINKYLQQHHPDYIFAAPLLTLDGAPMVYKEGDGYYRLLPFIAGSHSKNVVETPDQAYEAAAQFAKFTSRLSGIDVQQLKITIPFFHDLPFRYNNFLTAVEKGNAERKKIAQGLIQQIASHATIVDRFTAITTNSFFKKRVTHHDTKISNVLFDDKDKGICVIDLDTVMPGYFISDVGDMMRTYLCAVNEEETDIHKVEIREDFYRAIVDGYSEEMKDDLTAEEKKAFFYAGTFMIYMQALRFLTDYLTGDQYYPIHYPQHNLMRATNQVALLENLFAKKQQLERYS